MELTCEMVQSAINDMFTRCAEARSAGGIALEDVFNQTHAVPEGWWLDQQTSYYLPAGFQFSSADRSVN